MSKFEQPKFPFIPHSITDSDDASLNILSGMPISLAKVPSRWVRTCRPIHEDAPSDQPEVRDEMRLNLSNPAFGTFRSEISKLTRKESKDKYYSSPLYSIGHGCQYSDQARNQPLRCQAITGYAAIHSPLPTSSIMRTPCLEFFTMVSAHIRPLLAAK